MMEHEFQTIMPELDVSGNKRLEKIKQKLIKKMSFNSSKDLTTLRDLFYWVYIYNYSEKFTQLYPLGLSLEFNGNRNLWTPCELILSLIYYASCQIVNQENYARLALDKIFATGKDMAVIKERCDGLFLINRERNVQLALEADNHVDLRDALYLELMELVAVYSFGGSEKYPLNRIKKRVDEIKRQLQTM